MSRRRRGFTLVELLVALAIFAVISVLSIRALSAALDHRTHIENETRKWRDLGRLYAALESDLAAALSGAGTTFDGLPAPAGDDGLWLRFARAGRIDEDQAAIAPRGVRYRLAGGHVERATFHAIGPGDSDNAIGVSRYPSQVSSLRLRYLSLRGEWLPAWPESTTILPRAIEIDLELVTHERIRRVLLVR